LLANPCVQYHFYLIFLSVPASFGAVNEVTGDSGSQGSFSIASSADPQETRLSDSDF
jgi:hypothetical protein